MNIEQHKIRFIRKNLIKKNSLILDLGCGVGIPEISNKQIVIGIDLSYKSLEIASQKHGYALCIKYDLNIIPFIDEYFDFVIVSEIIGHLTEYKKNILLNEIFRVIKKGGILIANIETFGWINKYLKNKNEEEYKKNVILFYGHFGLESGEDAIQRLKRHGFKILSIKKRYSFLLPVNIFLEYFEHSYSKKNYLIKIIIWFYDIINKSTVIRELLDYFLMNLQNIIEYFLPLSSSDNIFVICKK